MDVGVEGKDEQEMARSDAFPISGSISKLPLLAVLTNRKAKEMRLEAR